MRLEQQDAYRTDFEARVVEAETRDDGFWLRLDRSLFYPTSGGQPHDTGELGGVRVVDVRLEGGAVWHRLQDGGEGAGPPPGAEVRGRIDWERRFRHMQRHTAQHLLSQAFVRVSPAFATRSVSLSSPDATVDLAGEPDDDALERAQRIVAEAAYRDLPIAAFEVDESELDAYALRRPPKVRGRVRLVAMGDWELSACGGTHLRSTAQAAPIALLRRERIRGGLTRVTFRSGWEGLEHHREVHAAADAAARSFSAPIAELPERVTALREEAAASSRRVAAVERRLAEAWAARLRTTDGDLVVHLLEEGDAALLAPLADALAAAEGVVALLGARDGARARLLFARGPGDGPDLAALLRAALPHVEGRGGGRPERAQGAGERVEGLESALASARALLVDGGAIAARRGGRG